MHREEDIMKRGLLAIVLLTASAPSGAQAMEYKGLCEASAGAFLDATHFAVASDETNTLQIYERGKPEPIGPGVDMEDFTGFDKSDLEGAAAIGDRVYWISSHSFNSKGEDKKKRKVFFATKVVTENGKPTLKPFGKVITSLRDGIAAAAGAQPAELNIEALSATPQRGLLIGLRQPLREIRNEKNEIIRKEAIVVALDNPEDVVSDDPSVADEKKKPKFGTKLITLDLKGRALRSMDLIGTNPALYIIVAGPVEDGPGFALFRWNGPGTDPTEIKDGPDLTALTPEGAMAVPNTKLVQLLSDDGRVDGVKCDDENDPPDKRKFRSIDVTIKP
jgi:hypothetical protein